MLIKQQRSFCYVIRCCVFCTLLVLPVYKKVTAPCDIAKCSLFYKHDLYICFKLCFLQLSMQFLKKIQSNIDEDTHFLYFFQDGGRHHLDFSKSAILDPL